MYQTEKGKTVTTLLIILLAVALCVAVGYIARLRRDLLDSQDLSVALVLDNERLRRKNSELAVVSTVVYAAARHHEATAAALAVENESHLVSLNMVLAEMER